MFGISIIALRKASTVAELETKVQAQAQASLENCQAYTQALRETRENLKLVEECDRLLTASTTLALVEQLSAAKAEDVVEVLAKGAIATSAAAMAECLKKAATLTGILEGISWDIIEGITALTDERQSKAQDILEMLVQALNSDEHVIALKPQLKQSQSQAVRLLTQQPKTPPTPISPPPITPPPVSPPPVSPMPPGAKSKTKGKPTTIIRKVSEGNKADIGLKATEDLLHNLGKKLKPGENIRLNISWIVEETVDGTASKENRNA